jgi:hypothetical protein
MGNTQPTRQQKKTELSEEFHFAVCSRLGLEQSKVYITLLSQSIETPLNATQEPTRAEDPCFQGAILTEIRGLLSRGVFVLASESDLPEGAKVLGSRFHLTIKSKNENVRYKSRLVVQGHLDAEKEFVVFGSHRARR